MVEIHTLELGPMENLVYLIEDSQSATAAVVDPAWEVGKILQLVAERELKITTILLTHGHSDHINGVEQLQQESGAEVYISRQDASFFGLEEMGWNLFDAPFSHSLGESEITAIATPGHTPGGTCYYLGGNWGVRSGNLLTGDTLFVYGCGRCDLEGGDAVAMYHSLRGLVERFDPQTAVFPGHNYSTQISSTLAQERSGNPFLQFDSEEEFVHYRMDLHDRIRSAPYGPLGASTA